MVTAREKESSSGKMNTDESATGIQNQFARIQTSIIGEWFNWRRTGQNRYRNSANRHAAELDELVKQLIGTGTSFPIGILHSAGVGFSTLSPDEVRKLVAQYPDTDLVGFVRLTPDTNDSAIASYRHNAELKEEVRNVPYDMRNRSLSDLLEHGYVPVPRPIEFTHLVDGARVKDTAPVVGPLIISDDVAGHMVSWVKGPLLHDQLAGDSKQPRSKWVSEIEHNQLLAVSQMTGVWEARPALDEEQYEGLEGNVREHYRARTKGAVEGLQFLTGVKLIDNEQRIVYGMINGIVDAMVLNANPAEGNIGPYFDAALRNFLTDVNNVFGTTDDIRRAVFRDDAVNYHALYEMIRRIDFSHAPRWAVYDEDVAHIAENLHVHATQAQKAQYGPMVQLTRIGLQYHDAAEAGDRVRGRAIDIAEKLASLRKGEVKPEDIPEVARYQNEFETTLQIMPWLRVLRQGELAIDYLAKGYALEERTGALIDKTIKASLAQEAQFYFGKVQDMLTSVISAAGLSRSSEIKVAMHVFYDFMGNVNDRVSKNRFSKDNLIRRGENYLTELR